MKKIILKRHPEKKNLYEIINSIFHKVFKERVLIANKNGKFTYYRFSPALQSICFLLFFGMIYWTLFTTRIYLLNVDTLKNKDTQIIDARNKFNKVVADINAYKDTISEINKKLEISNNNIVNLLEKDEKLTKLEKDTLVKNRLLLSSELNYANDKLNSFAKGITWANIDTKEPYYRTTKNELERNVVLNENV